MSSDFERIKTNLEAAAAKPTRSLDIDAVWKRGLWRRYIVMAAVASFATVGTVAAVQLVPTIKDVPHRDSEVGPASEPRTCSPDQIQGVTTDIRASIGTGAGHPGVYFEARITGHSPACEPTMYIELDGKPALPPDGAGPDADEFRRSIVYLRDQNPCLVTDSVAGDFLYSEEHVIGVGVGCNPDDPWPHPIQEKVRFDGDSQERVSDQT